MQLRRKIRWRRTRGELVLYGIGSLIMVAIIYYVLHQSPSAGE